MALVNFVTSLEMDDQTISELHELRSLRVNATKNLLDNIESTLSDLVASGTYKAEEVTEQFIENLKEMLSLKLKVLESRSYQDHFFDDEIALYSDIEVSAANEWL